MNEIKIMIINNEKHYISIVTNVLLQITKSISAVQNLDKAFNILSCEDYDFVITDYHLFDKKYTIQNFISPFPKTELIIAASSPSYSDGSYSLQNGASDYIDLNKEINTLTNKIQSILSNKKKRADMKESLLNGYLLNSNNENYKKMLIHCEKVANSKVNILLTGESGSGKEVAAKYIHLCSSRSSNSFVAVNCSSFTETLLESELFGHEHGSFTGATKSKEGKFELSNNGTLFLDEVGDINLTTQVKLLRVLETKKVERLGSNIEKYIDFRLISATNKDLPEEVASKNFREDFFYRISSIVINVPSLKDRPEDLDSLIKYFLEKSQEENNIKITGMDEQARDFLFSYEYPGNIRELKSIIDRMVVLSSDGIITKDGIPILYNIKKKTSQLSNANSLHNQHYKLASLKDFRRESESEYIRWVLEQTGGNVSEAAQKLQISTRQLFNKISEYDIDRTSKRL